MKMNMRKNIKELVIAFLKQDVDVKDAGFVKFEKNRLYSRGELIAVLAKNASSKVLFINIAKHGVTTGVVQRALGYYAFIPGDIDAVSELDADDFGKTVDSLETLECI